MEQRKLLLTDRHLQDLNPVTAGWHECEPGHRFGPYVRGYTLIHYVRSGKGVFYTRGEEYEVTAGQAFLILPGEVTTYEADKLDPWHYCWVGFNGSLARRFDQLEPVFSIDESLFLGIFPPEGYVGRSEYWLAGGLHRLYGVLFPDAQTGNIHVQKVENLICTAYMERITVEDIAGHLNLDRRYLTRLFKQHTGKSLQEYLTGVRMEEAMLCLERGHSVQETARLCGYSDVGNFSKMYKKFFGYNPKKK